MMGKELEKQKVCCSHLVSVPRKAQEKKPLTITERITRRPLMPFHEAVCQRRDYQICLAGIFSDGCPDKLGDSSKIIAITTMRVVNLHLPASTRTVAVIRDSKPAG